MPKAGDCHAGNHQEPAAVGSSKDDLSREPSEDQENASNESAQGTAPGRVPRMMLSPMVRGQEAQRRMVWAGGAQALSLRLGCRDRSSERPRTAIKILRVYGYDETELKPKFVITRQSSGTCEGASLVNPALMPGGASLGDSSSIPASLVPLP
jgi:hypothetical protein